MGDDIVYKSEVIRAVVLDEYIRKINDLDVGGSGDIDRPPVLQLIQLDLVDQIIPGFKSCKNSPQLRLHCHRQPFLHLPNCVTLPIFFASREKVIAEAIGIDHRGFFVEEEGDCLDVRSAGEVSLPVGFG